MQDDETIINSPNATAAPTASLGQMVAGRYRLDQLIARGQFGSVWRAEDAADGQWLAIKLLRSKRRADPVARTRFEREAKLLTRLTHPNVVRCLDFGVVRQHEWYLALELLDGCTLQQQITAEGPLGSRATHALGIQLLQALSEAHALGVVHRDVKPENVMMCPGGAKLIDWGIAKVLWPEPVNLTLEGTVLGSLRYLPPEQIRGEPVTSKSDVYAVGCVLHEALGAEPPFIRETQRELAKAHLFAAPTAPTRDGDALRGPLIDLIIRMLSKTPETRPTTPEALSELAGMQAPYLYRVSDNGELRR